MMSGDKALINGNEESCLLCSLGDVHIGLPDAFVDRVIDYEVTSALPLSRTHSLYLGIYDGQVIVSVGLEMKMSGSSGRAAKGVLLTRPVGSVPCAIEVSSVAAFVRTLSEEGAPTADSNLPHWVKKVRNAVDQNIVALLDIPAMLQSFGVEGFQSGLA